MASTEGERGTDAEVRALLLSSCSAHLLELLDRQAYLANPRGSPLEASLWSQAPLTALVESDSEWGQYGYRLRCDGCETSIFDLHWRCAARPRGARARLGVRAACAGLRQPRRSVRFREGRGLGGGRKGGWAGTQSARGAGERSHGHALRACCAHACCGLWYCPPRRLVHPPPPPRLVLAAALDTRTRTIRATPRRQLEAEREVETIQTPIPTLTRPRAIPSPPFPPLTATLTLPQSPFLPPPQSNPIPSHPYPIPSHPYPIPSQLQLRVRQP